jgi:S-adenosyl-L-methionine hydrolase (adenosine-forming)
MPLGRFRTVDGSRDLAYPWIWLLTDYGRRDGFVASCRGVIARIAPAARVEDITHDVPAQDIRHGAAVLAQTVRYLPRSIVVGVVDPGVGTPRRAVAIVAGEIVLVGPDNGLLLWAADAVGGASAAFELTDSSYVMSVSSRTFAGRDVFAPAAAHVAIGVAPAALGPALPVEELIRLPAPRVESRPGVLDAEVLSVDRFGNVQLSATVTDLTIAGLGSGVVQVGVPDRSYVATVGATFADVPLGEVVLFVDSAGHLALAVNGGDAATMMDLHPGDDVVLTR